ncbi:hypothetical protein CASFOL_021712 [Castilleja foliolosa]|uniref:Aspartic peptidase DDI1-type domain-containing protein n=1 Tax=Castilleja foliolosa TaxID=1961234 RepID=A0ABD3CXD6_9LAMI
MRRLSSKSCAVFLLPKSCLGLLMILYFHQCPLSAPLSVPPADSLLPCTDNGAQRSRDAPISKSNDPKLPNPVAKVNNGLHRAEKRYIPGSLKGTIPQRAQDQEITQETRDSVPFPSRLRPPKENKLFDDMYNLLKDVNVSIPLLELIRTVPTYVKFFKDLIARDKKGITVEKVRALEEINEVNKSVIPPKLGDPGSFCIAIKLGNGGTARGMLDLGAGINLMPYALYKQLDIGEMVHTDMRLQMADRSIRQPMGVVKNVLVQVDNLFIPSDFVILDVGEARLEGKEQTILLGRPFMATSRAIIDVHEGRITLRAFDQSVTFDMQKLMNTPSPLLDVGYIEEEVINEANEEFFGKTPFSDESDDEFVYEDEGMADFYEMGMMNEEYEPGIPPDLKFYEELEPLSDYLELDYVEDDLKEPGITYDGLEKKEDDEPFKASKEPFHVNPKNGGIIIVEKERAPSEHVP